ncbi:MAG: glycosyltransferase family 39 protein [Lachnospiraceae bacterium]|nr:glycosyltransferase family 39 protein [Lachnospiraceae bacterium]
MKAFNIICIIAMIGFLMVLALEKLEGRSASEEEADGSVSEKWKLRFGKEFWVVLIYGIIAIRCIGLGNIPGGFNQDGAMGAVDALALAQYGTDRFGTHLPAHFEAWGYGQMSVLLSYLTVPFIKIWGLNALTARLPMMIVSVLGAAAVYGLVKELISEKAAVAALLFTAINPWHFMQSRWALDCNVFPHMFIIGTYFLVKGLKKSRNYYFAMIFYALCMYSYGVSFYMVPFFLLITCIMLLVTRKINLKQTGICMLVYFGLAFPIYGTMLINFMKWETVGLPFVTIQYFEGSIRSNDMLFFSEEPLKQLVNNLRSLIRVVFLQKPDLIWNAIDDFGTMYQCSMPLILIGLGITCYMAAKEKDEKERIISRILLIYWGCSMFTGLCINSVNVNRINIIFYSHIIFAGIAIYHLVRKWKLFGMALLIIYCIQSLLFFNRYFTRWADEMEDIFYEDFIEAVDFAGNQECDYYYITPDTQYTGSWNVSEILTLFALEMDAEYYQGETNRFRGAEISYRDRYRFSNPSPEEIRTDQKIAYVIKTESLVNYDLNQFRVRYFDDYCVVMPGSYATW